MAAFKAIRIDKAEKGTTAALAQFDEAELMEGDVTVRVEWSTVNYKDGLAVTGKAPVVRRFPMIAGIDFAGTVEQSSHAAVESRRQGRLHRLGHGRDASWRLCREGARQRRLAGAAAGGYVGTRGDGDRHRRLHRDAGGAGAGAARHLAAKRSDRRHRRGRRRRLGRDRGARRSSAITSSPPPGECRKRLI